MRGFYRAILLGGASLAAFPVSAQVTDQSAQAGTTNTLGDIVVTAQRREERAQDVPIAITAFSNERLQQQGVTQAQDLQASVPSLVVGPNGQGSRETQSFTIRGQGATFQASPGVVVYLNEVPLPAPITLSQQGGPGNFVDLENLQVLNGPQGTLFGRNTTGGAVLLVPHRPTNEFSGYAQAKLGNFSNREFEGALNVPIVDEKVLLRVTGAYQDRDGYTHDVVWNKNRDNLHWYSGRIGLTLKPTETLENYTMVYGAYSRNHAAGLIHRAYNIAGLQGVGFCVDPPLTPPGPSGIAVSCSVYRAADAYAASLGPRATALSIDEFQKTRTWGITNTTKLELSDQLTLRNIVSYQRFLSRYRYDGDATPLQQHDVDPGVLPSGPVTIPGGGGTYIYANATGKIELPRDHIKEVTEELQLQGKFLENRLNVTAGGFYYDQSPAGIQGSASVLYCPAAFTGFCSPQLGRIAVSQKSKALYAQGTLDLGALTPSLENLKVTGGIRYTWDKVSGTAQQYRIAGFDPATGTVTGPFTCAYNSAQVADAASCAFSAVLKTNEPTWTVGVDYRTSPELLLYAKVSRGYKAGGFNGFAVFDNTRTFKPEFVTSYEVGFKSNYKVGGIPTLFNANYFYEDYNNIQRATGDFNPTTLAGGARTLNATARLQGVELEASIRPLHGVEIGGNFSYVDAKYKRYNVETRGPTLDCSGATIPFGGTANLKCLPFQYLAPYIFSLHGSIEHDLSSNLGTLALFVNYSHTSAQHTEAVVRAPDQPGERLEPFGLLSLSLDWRNVAGTPVDVGFYATNLTNKLYRISNTDVYQGGALLYWTTLYGEPRMYGVKLRYHFGK
jgi:iron complex outermembrane receptor protein